MRKNGSGFKNSCKCDIFKRCISALDGWLVNIKLQMARDGVSRPSDFFSRKVFC